MIYPIISYDDGTEVTASKPDADGNVSIYTEKFDESQDKFIYAEIIIPHARVKSFDGYSKETLSALIKRYSAIENDILEYVAEKEKVSA